MLLNKAEGGSSNTSTNPLKFWRDPALFALPSNTKELLGCELKINFEQKEDRSSKLLLFEPRSVVGTNE